MKKDSSKQENNELKKKLQASEKENKKLIEKMQKIQQEVNALKKELKKNDGQKIILNEEQIQSLSNLSKDIDITNLLSD